MSNLRDNLTEEEWNDLVEKVSRKTGDDEQRFLRHLVDVVWNECTMSQEVPSTNWANQMIQKARESFR